MLNHLAPNPPLERDRLPAHAAGSFPPKLRRSGGPSASTTKASPSVKQFLNKNSPPILETDWPFIHPATFATPSLIHLSSTGTDWLNYNRSLMRRPEPVSAPAADVDGRRTQVTHLLGFFGKLYSTLKIGASGNVRSATQVLDQ